MESSCKRWKRTYVVTHTTPNKPPQKKNRQTCGQKARKPLFPESKSPATRLLVSPLVLKSLYIAM